MGPLVSWPQGVCLMVTVLHIVGCDWGGLVECGRGLCGGGCSVGL